MSYFDKLQYHFAGLNTDEERRDELLQPFWEKGVFGRKRGGVQYFEGLDVKTLQTLVTENFAERDDRQNNAPTIAAILRFMKKWPEFTAHGYAVGYDRDDCRVSITGIERRGKVEDSKMVSEFEKLFRKADDLVVEDDYMYCDFD